MQRGEFYRVQRPGGDPKRSRVFVIVSRKVLIDSKFSKVVCAPVFSRGEGLTTQIPVGSDEGLKHGSWIMCDNLVSIRKVDLTDYIGSLPSHKFNDLNRALATALELR